MPKLSKFLRDLFENLNTSEIEYCVVGKTFSKFDINTKMISYFEHNKFQRLQQIEEILKNNKDEIFIDYSLL